MTINPDGTGAGRLQRQKNAPPKKRRGRTRAGLTVTAVAGGAVACTGVAFGVAPIAEAFSMMIPVSDGSGGTGNNIQVNILEGNVFDTQLGILGGNVSNNTTGGGIADGQGSTGSTTGTGNGNTTQINILSYNIWNPQVSIFGGNMSTNKTVSNQATNNGNGVDNNSTADAAAAPGGLLGGMLLGGMNGNGNTTQLAFLSGNITNPQFTLFGANMSNNTASTNVASGNGNGSTQYLSAGYISATMFGMNGNGNTTQAAAGTSNILNPQFSFGSGNSSVNTSTTNSSSDNGNGSGTSTGGGLFGNTTFFGLTGNGNSSQTATGSGTISNDQINFGWTKFLPITNTTSVNQQPNAAGTDSVVTSNSNTAPVDTPTTTVVATGSSSGASGSSAPVDNSGSTSATGPSAPNPSYTRITTVVNQTLGAGSKTLLTPIGTTGGSGAAGHFSLPEPIKKLIASIPGMPKADDSASTPSASEGGE